MLYKLVFPIVACVSALGLYFDFLNQNRFQKKISKSKKIAGKELVSGIIKTDDNLLGCFGSNIITSHMVVYELSIMSRKKYRFYNYSYDKKKMVKPLTRSITYWYTDKNDFFICPSAKFNGCELLLNANTKIYYPKKNNTRISKNMMHITKYIPNNYPITIFGKKISDDKYEISCMGSRDDVVADIAYNYYNINSTTTVALSVVFILATLFGWKSYI